MWYSAAMLQHNTTRFENFSHCQNFGDGQRSSAIQLCCVAAHTYTQQLLAIYRRRESRCVASLRVCRALDSRFVLSNSYPNACVPCRETVCTLFNVAFGMNRPGHESATYRMRRTRLSLSQPDAVPDVLDSKTLVDL